MAYQRLTLDELYNRFSDIYTYDELIDNRNAYAEACSRFDFENEPFFNDERFDGYRQDELESELSRLEMELEKTLKPKHTFSNIDFSGLDFTKPITNSHGKQITIRFDTNETLLFDHVNFAHADMSRLRFNNIQIHNSDLSDANLFSATLCKTQITASDLTDTNFRNVRFINSHITACNIANTIFINSNLNKPNSALCDFKITQTMLYGFKDEPQQNT